MLEFNFSKTIPALPREKEVEVAGELIADGVRIKLSIEVFMDSRSWDWIVDDFLTYHLTFRSSKKELGDRYNMGEKTLEEIPNPISETGYRSQYITISIKELDDFDIQEYLNKWLRVRLDGEEKRWERSKQYSLF